MAASSNARRILTGLALCVGSMRAGGQSPALAQAMIQESRGQLRESAASYRSAITPTEFVQALLGLERVYAQLGWRDSLVSIVDSVVARNPAEPMTRTVQLRTLRAIRRTDEADAAFHEWTRVAPRDIAPYREWSRLLLAEGKFAEVDSVVLEAQRTLGNVRGLASEIAQLRVALGQWDRAAVAWREAIVPEDYLTSAAAFSLRAAPDSARRVVRLVLLSPPATAAPRQLLASLELSWGNGRDAWFALRDLPRNDSTADAWSAFAEDAERRGQWLAARDALQALQQWRPDAQRALRAATLAVEGGDPSSALLLAAQAAEKLGPRDGPKTALAVRLRAYAALGRGADAQKAYDAVAAQLAPGERASLRRTVAWAWVRGGGVAEARAMLTDAASDPDDELTGWLALFDGDLAGARRGLRRADPRAGDAVNALALLSRTRVDTARAVGVAFLALARGDTLKAANAFAQSADSLPDAASVLLLMAARLHSAQKRPDQAMALWKRVVETQPATPEAPEAELEWARLLRERGDRTNAISHLEHLILSWPESALLPQARRELDLARGAEGNA